MNYMKPLGCLSISVMVAALANTGCSRPPKPPAEETRQGAREAILPIDELRKAQNTAGYRDALGKLNAEIANKAQVTQAQRDVLEKRFHLTPEEMKAVESGTFQPLDANHVESCFFFRDIARALDISNLASPEIEMAKARHAFAWVIRHVQWRESDEVLPPEVILRVGRGSPRDRAVVFLAILQQLHMEGCLVVLPGKKAPESGQLVVGVLLGKKASEADVYLFDPRLGLPLPGEKGIATLAELRVQQSLFCPAATLPIPSIEWDFKVYLATSLQALAPRFKALERRLAEPDAANQDRVVLGLEPDKWLARWESIAGKDKVVVWNSPAKPRLAPSPFRALAAYLPTEEHGQDTTKRKALMEGTLVPSLWPLVTTWPMVLRKYDELRLGEMPAPVQANLLVRTKQLFDRYVVEPRTMLQRGQFEQVKLRVGAVHTPVHMLDQSDLAERLQRFRKEAKDAAIEMTRLKKDDKLNRLLFDPFLYGLLELRRGERNQQDGDNRGGIEKHDIKDALDPTFIIFAAAAPALKQEHMFLQAQRWHDQAARAQAKFKLPNKGGENEQSVQAQWHDCVSSWSRYIEATGDVLADHTALLGRMLKGRNLDGFLSWYDPTLHEMHKFTAAQYFRARAKAQRGKTDEALRELAALATPQEAELKQLLSEALTLAQAGSPAAALMQVWQRDFDREEGGFAWLRRAALISARQIKAGI
jgi:hypothetical protein